MILIHDSEDSSKVNLLSEIKELVATERKITQKILEKLLEVDRTMLYAKMGYSSLFDFCIKELGYSEGAANRRISAMRLLRQLPELKFKLQNNEVSLSTLTQLKSFISRVEKSDKHKMTTQDKSNLVQLISSKNQKECEKVFVELAPLVQTHREVERVVSTEMVEVKFYLSLRLQSKVQRARELLSHSNHSMDYASLFDRLLEDFLRRRDPLRKVENPSAQR